MFSLLYYKAPSFPLLVNKVVNRVRLSRSYFPFDFRDKLRHENNFEEICKLLEWLDFICRPFRVWPCPTRSSLLPHYSELDVISSLCTTFKFSLASDVRSAFLSIILTSYKTADLWVNHTVSWPYANIVSMKRTPAKDCEAESCDYESGPLNSKYQPFWIFLWWCCQKGERR